VRAGFQVHPGEQAGGAVISLCPDHLRAVVDDQLVLAVTFDIREFQRLPAVRQAGNCRKQGRRISLGKPGQQAQQKTGQQRCERLHNSLPSVAAWNPAGRESGLLRTIFMYIVVKSLVRYNI
jgi:hypothetical protein